MPLQDEVSFARRVMFGEDYRRSSEQRRAQGNAFRKQRRFLRFEYKISTQKKAHRSIESVPNTNMLLSKLEL